MVHMQSFLHLRATCDEVFSQVQFQYTVHAFLQNNKKTVSRSDGSRFQEIWITPESRLQDGRPHSKRHTTPDRRSKPTVEDADARYLVHSRGLSH
jgi:hypothetical protein